MMQFDRMTLGKKARELGFSENVPREEMLAIRKQITERISKYMAAAGYHLSQKSKTYHALDSFV